jgi:bifunctional DNA-binding transcriptional regulator/antitoxin component of YhaV-PrlF toxin-antitoxin module
MTYATTITQKWQMTLPKAIRIKLGITKPGKATVSLTKRGDITISQSPSIFDLAGTIKPKKTLPATSLREIADQQYERT